MEINEFYIRLMGSAYCPEELEIGKSYLISCEGEIVSSTDENNQDGTGKRTYKFKPATIEILKDNGKTVKLTTGGQSLSKKFRGALWYLAQEKGWDGDEVYERTMKHLIAIVSEEPEKLIEFLKQMKP